MSHRLSFRDTASGLFVVVETDGIPPTTITLLAERAYGNLIEPLLPQRAVRQTSMNWANAPSLALRK